MTLILISIRGGIFYPPVKTPSHGSHYDAVLLVRYF